MIMIGWGLTASFMPLIVNFAGLAVCRFLLGSFEAGLFPGVIYYMSIWYPRREQARRLGFFWSFSSLAGAFGGILAFGIQQIPADKLASWQWLFLIEGLPTMVFAIATIFLLPDSPEKAKFLNEEEREYEIRRLAADAGSSNDHSWAWAQVWSVFTDWKTYAYMIIYLTGTSALSSRLHLISLLSSSPSHLAGAPIDFLIVLFIWLETTYKALKKILLNVHALLNPSLTSGGLTRRAVASAAIVSIGTIGGAIGGQIYYDPPRYFGGNTIAISCMAVQTVLVMLLRVVFKYENSRRDRLTEAEKAAEVAKYGGPELAGDRHPDFRYIL
ncbi:major facilitator superfamily domain-containing protein [Endogone sp. FLAS-F59071]|nr:major facilitator superfamily domain-containing protein [Endogone sp. FLAS-F59071]|eukprot:RUS15172.1 major facilitator superfamily domain-containing protein [Endogone sp. FLAS-F59071]